MKNLNILFNLKMTCAKLISIFSFLFFYSIANGQYCVSNGNETSDEYIAKVQLGSINNSSYATNSGYQNFTNQSAKLTKGNTYEIKITPVWTDKIYKEGYSVWIDFNRDGDFNDAYEQVVSKSPTTSNLVRGNIKIPNSAATGLTRMRVSMSYKQAPEACESFDYGEVEDYSVVIEPDINNDETNNNQANNNTTYCISNGNRISNEYIAKVEFGNINNSSFVTNSGYQNFTSQNTKLAKGNTYEIKITLGGTNRTYQKGYSVWIDFNKDGDFNDLAEQVWYKKPTTLNLVKGDIRIPNSVSTGLTRMRVSMSYDQIPRSCGNFDSGEVEDYTVFIEPVDNNEPVIEEVENNDLVDQGNFSAEMEELLALVNKARQNNGLAPLVMIQSLSEAAKAHANDMINNSFFSHTGFNGSNPGDRISLQGYSFSAWAENIAYGYLTAQSVFDAWMDSPGHRANILRSTVTEIGQVRVQNHWVQVFARPSGQNRLASNKIFNFETYPNPASNGFIFIKGNSNWEETNYQLISISGAIVKNGRLESNRLDLAGLVNGIYSLHLTNNSGKIRATEKIVINRH